MKSKQATKKAEPQGTQDDSEADRPIWFLGKELKDKPKAEERKAEPAAEAVQQPKKKAERSKKVEKAQPEPESAEALVERRPSPLEAYMRYAKMREPRDDDGLAPIGTRRFPSGEHQAANDENDMSWAGDVMHRRRQRRASGGLRWRDAVFAGIASVAIGALAGAVVYDRTNDGQLSATAFDAIGQFLTGLNLGNDAVAAANTGALPENRSSPAAFKKPVTTASLEVSDAKGDVNTPIPLSISAEPALPDQDIALRLSGLPADAYLTAGTKLADNAWILKPAELRGVKLMVPSAPASPLLIAVDAIEPRTGDLAAPTEEMKVAINTPSAPSQVEPASAPPTDVKRNFNLPPTSPHEKTATAQPIPAPNEDDGQPSAADSASLMRNGDKLLGVGDFTAARAFFSRARELGNREASLRLGQTYDPIVFRDRNVQGLKPDPTMALKYYLEARTAGIEDADTAINGLESWLKQ
jgi:hypothetical protein